jgi:hypothetical protein
MGEIPEDGHVDSPGNIHYSGLGIPCPSCKKVFVICDADLESHKSVCKGSGLNSLEWRKSSFDDSEFVSVTEDPQLLYTIEHQGKTRILDHEYFLSKNKKWIKRRKVAFY